MDENVLQMPTPLDRLAGKLQKCLTQEAANREEWIAIQEAKCATLAEIRDQFISNKQFGQWCRDNGFGDNTLNADTRGACIAMGRDLAALRQCLEATTRGSLDTIYRWEFDAFRSVPKMNNKAKTARSWSVPKKEIEPELSLRNIPKTPSPRKARLTTAKIPSTAEALRPHIEAGEPISEAGWAEKLGVARATIQRAREYELGRLEGLNEAQEPPPLDPAEMQPTTKQRYEAALRKARNELREEITAEISESYQLMIDRTRERVARADRIIASHQGVMSHNTFRKIKACLHPDHNTFQFAAEALQAFSQLEKVLVKPEDTTPVASGLPRTAAELMAHRRHRPA